MLSQNEQSAVLSKARELCQTILQQPSMVSARERIDAFLGNEEASSLYQSLITKGQALQQKQQLSMTLSDEEIADFESHREQVLANPVSKAFLDAQNEMREISHSVNKFLSMTMETGQAPSDEEFQSATCGHGCNCH
jgi:cell fate (sporulation/competence/biofilm development) regulator YlbF (YheA/YmcA/DUF963 family)